MSKNKVKIERQLSKYKWTSIEAEYALSRNMNYYAKNEGQVYVWKKFSEGIPVVSVADGKWIQVGRITRHREVFLGEGQSYDEYCYSPEGVEASRRALTGLRAAKIEQVPRGGLM